MIRAWGGLVDRRSPDALRALSLTDVTASGIGAVSGFVQHPVDGGPGDGEQVSQLRDAVATLGMEFDQMWLLARVELSTAA